MKKKAEKIPYQEYQALKEKAGKNHFKLKFYPLPVLISILLPLLIFILAMIFYFVNVKNFEG